MQTQNPQENNVSECLPKNKKAYKERESYFKEYYEKNKARYNDRDRIEYYRKYREKNKEKQKRQSKAYYEANKEQLKEKKKDYRKKRLKEDPLFAAKCKLRQKDYRKKRLKEDPLFAAKCKLRHLVKDSFRRISKNKPTDTQTLLGCDWQTAKQHFERLFKEGMSWENHGLWHIDHIRPVASFAEDELHLMNLISNLQPLWAEDNISKSDKIPPTPIV